MDKNVSIVGNLCLGEYPRSLAQLPVSFESLPSVRPNPIAVNSSWFDLTMLSYLAILFRSCKRPESDLTLQFEDAKKYSFLWRSGFFSASHIGHRGSSFKVVPDIWPRRPEDLDARANFTPLINLEVSQDQTTAPQVRGYSEIAKDAAKSLLLELEKTNVYSLIERSDLMESREYLHIVLWELVQNIIDHAKASHAIIAAQVFYKGRSNGNRAISGLRAQHDQEERYCELPLRKEWLKKNRKRDYLMLSCVDNGIGIPVSLRLKNGGQDQDDRQLLGLSFQRESSDHDTFEHRYAIHGLHLIAQLVSSYEGYLFAQSGTAFLELTQQNKSPATLQDEMALPGTAFQILLPLNAGEPRPYFKPGSHQGAKMERSLIYATEVLRERTYHLPPSLEEQQPAVDYLVRTASKTSGTLFLDFMGMPRERHFTSLLLLCVRRKKTEHPVVILNAPEELFTAIGGLRSPTSTTTRDEEFKKIDRALATDLTRGEGPALLPLVVAVTRLRDASKPHSDERLPQPGIAIQWLGIADDGPHSLESCLVALLDELFCTDGAIDESLLEDIVISMGKNEETARAILRNTQRANPNLLFYDSGARQWHLAFNASNLYFDSVESLNQQLHKAVNDSARFDAQANTIFYLNWRSADSYLQDYYQLWPVVRDPELARIAATLLMRLAHDDSILGPQIAQLGALISVTASAGLLAREIARILRIPHWEAPSVYDLDSAEWPQDFDGTPVLIIDDLIDTGTASRLVVDELAHRKAKCIGILSVLASVEGREARKLLKQTIISLMEVKLGRPTPAEIKAAEDDNKVWDVDPHTLEPKSRKTSITKASKTDRLATKKYLSELSLYGGLRSGHFVYGGHHYYEFFDVVRYMESSEGFHDMRSWFKEAVSKWYSQTVVPIGGSVDSVAIIYPYYSPIAAFLHRIQALLSVDFKFSCSIHVACPYQRSRQRVGYRLDSLGTNDRFAVFIDDGVASGGTLSEVIDEFVSIHNTTETKGTTSTTRKANGSHNWKAAILALPVFDRIGMTPRKHLKSIEGYHGSVRFEFEPKYSLNLRAYYAKDCPLCRIESDIGATFRSHSHVSQQLETILVPVRQLLSPTYLTAIATCAPMPGMGLLRNDDAATVVNASDALFSDQVSGSEIKRSIQDTRKSSIARLEILLTVMMDPILFRSVHDKEFFIDTIINELWCGGVSNEYRSLFLMHIPYLHSRDLARLILLKAIPKSLLVTDPLLVNSEPIETQTDAGLVRQTPTRYFDEHPEVFASILTAIWVLRGQEEGLPQGWDDEWCQTLRETPYRHQFVCSTTLTEVGVARASAVMLLCNFVTHYRGHREALQRRIEDLRNLVEAGIREDAIPRHTLVYLANAIKVVRDYYVLEDGLLSSDITTQILSLYDAWLDGNDSAGLDLRKKLNEHFAPEETICEATITQQLRDGLAPTIDVVIEKAKCEYEKWYFKETSDEIGTDLFATNFESEAHDLHVFGNTRFIVLTVVHLLRNAYENSIDQENNTSQVRPEIILAVEAISYNGGDGVRISVTNSQGLTQDQVDRCYRAGGGLMAQKQVNEKWGGGMGGCPSEGRQTVFFLDLETVDVERKGKV